MKNDTQFTPEEIGLIGFLIVVMLLTAAYFFA